MEIPKHPNLHPTLWGVEFSLDSVTLPIYTVPDNIPPEKIDLSTQLTPNIRLKRPLVSSPMDTVTGDMQAILLGREGGIGAIPFTKSVQGQMEAVERVRRYEAAFVENPVILPKTATINDALEHSARYGFSSFPVTEDGTRNTRMVGLVTEKDVEFEEDIGRSIQEVMTPFERLVVAHRRDTLDRGDIRAANRIIKEEKLDTLPIVDDEGKVAALVTRSDLKKDKRYPLATKDDNKQLQVLIAVDSELGPARERIEAAAGLGVSGIIVDSRNTYGDYGKIAEFTKKNYPWIDVIVGNVVTAKAVETAIEASGKYIDSFRVGIGTGEVCTTTEDLGIGRAMGSSLRDIASFLRTRNLPQTLIADGGIKNPGHIAKALALGAAAVMMGSELAGFRESPTDAMWKNGQYVKIVRGMGSEAAIRERAGQQRYMGSGSRIFYAEGIQKDIPYKGPGEPHLRHLFAGLAKIFQAVGCTNLDEFQRVAYLVPAVYPASKGTT